MAVEIRPSGLPVAATSARMRPSRYYILARWKEIAVNNALKECEKKRSTKNGLVFQTSEKTVSGIAWKR